MIRSIRLLAALLSLTATGAQAKTILFIGNSFTQGANSAVLAWGRESVTDLNHDRVGGVPALFKRLADEAGLDWTVSLETHGGAGLDFHYRDKRTLIDRPWDAVVMQGRSDLNETLPGNPDVHIAHAGLLARMFHHANPAVIVALMATWSRADLTYPPGKRWSGSRITRMAEDLAAASAEARRRAPEIGLVLPVGAAWNRAFAEGVADPDPYDGIAFGQVDLWAYDHYHASAAGYYLEALTVFGAITGLDPARFGPGEKAAEEIGLDPSLAVRLQQIARDTLADQRVSAR